MFYSRFDEKAGVYDVFEDDAERAVNADLPVPDLPSELNGIGVPASECGRPMPSGARHVGRSWSPRGIIVTPTPRGALSALGASESNLMVIAPLAIIAISIGLYLWYDSGAGRRYGWR